MSQTPEKKSIFVIAGETSGDLHGALLLEQLHTLRPDWSAFGIGGDKMRERGFEQIVGIGELAVIGFAGVVQKFFYFRQVFRHMKNLIDQRRPDAVMLIDYPGFNLRFACDASQMGFPIFYYIAPQIWAWWESRVEKLRNCADLLVPLFPFEEQYFREHGVAVERVGHPLLDIVEPGQDRDAFCEAMGVSPDRTMVALLPGSRPAEIRRHLPVMLAVAAQLVEHNPAILPVICRAAEIRRDLIQSIIAASTIDHVIVTTDTYSAINAAAIAMAKSGTSTVECAILGTPFVVMYKTGILNYQVARRLVKTPYLAMVNLIADRAVVPEFIQQDARPELIVPVMERLLRDPAYYQQMVVDLQDVREKLGPSGGATQAAEIFVQWLENRTP